MPPRAPQYWASVTPSDTATLGPCIGLFVTGTGNVTFLGNGGAAVTVTVPANFYLWGDIRQVLATGTTATGIFLLR
jgi:hypothetical protein